MRHRVIKVKGLVLVARDEVHNKIMHLVGKIFPIEQRRLLAVDGISLVMILRVPVFAAAVKAQIFVETPITRLQR